MKKLLLLITATLLPCVFAGKAAAAAGFTDSYVLFYGEVRQVGGAQTVLLQAGHLEMTFVNQSDPANRVTLETELKPTGVGATKLYSYALKVPLAYLPEAPRIDEFLSIGTEPTNFRIEEITINGTASTLPDGSKEFYGLSFASRAADYQLDLLVAGDSTDGDGDGLPDWWESLYGLDPGLADANGDPDADGWSNLEEFRRGGNPAVSNRDPQLVTAGLLIPESGEAGVYLHFLDSDTPSGGIDLAFSGSEESGFEIRIDGVTLLSGELHHLSLAELESGRLTIRHAGRALRQFTLPVSWNDGGEVASGQLLVRAVAASTGDASDASLWLDGHDLTNNGGGIGSWMDRSGNGRNASQPLPAHQPVARGHGADFANSPTAHLFFQDLAIANGNHTVCASYRAAASSDNAQTLLATNRGFLQLAPTTQAISYPGAPVYQMDGVAVRGFEDTTGANTTSIFRREGGLLENVFGLSHDGQNIAAVAIDPVLPTIGAWRAAVVANGADPVVEGFSGQLHELLVFPTALPEQKLRDVHDYLASKWDGSVIWDFSTELMDVTLAAVAGTRPQIIRGGHGDDHLGGGAADDTLSGGPGADWLTGGGGGGRFVFGALDTGGGRITAYDVEHDIIDLSALFWGQTGDARQSISVRLDANFSTEIPTLDSVLIVQRPGAVPQEIVLENTVVGSARLIQLIVEGRIRMGGLSIPCGVQIALAPGSATAPTSESLDQPFTIVATRSGDGVSAALDVPLGFFEDALGGHFVIDGAASNQGRRSVVTFARGQTSLTLTVRPVPDLEPAGSSSVQVAVLPHYKYAVGGLPVERTITDQPLVWLEVVQVNAVAEIGQPARLRVHRAGDLAAELTVDLQLGGTAEEGVHIQPVADNLTIPAGQESGEFLINARAEGLGGGPKVVLCQLASRDSYQLGNPHEAVLYAAVTATEANGAGFDRWLQAVTHGTMTDLADLGGMPRETVARYLQAYAFGLDTPADPGSHRVTFQIANGRPEIQAHGELKVADVRWTVESSANLEQWTDATTEFTETAAPAGLRFVGDSLPPQPGNRFYRLGIHLDPGQLASSSIVALAGTTRFGISGNTTWQTDQASGDLTSVGGSAGDTSRIIAEASGGTSLDFEMSVADAGADDLLVFYLDGVEQSRTSGGTVAVRQNLEGTAAHLLMWEFKRGTGNAVIHNSPK
ncbi:MAG: hypothetical protein K9M97_08210 [Akkermansiaceae bacterium]|nr:hypothetical protein [Akkermansiaceae bacterium]